MSETVITMITDTDSFENTNEATNPFSCDLVSNASKHIKFLNDAHIYRCLLKRKITSNTVSASSVSNDNIPNAIELESIRRYLHLWLPMIAEQISSHSDEANTAKLSTEICPPPDIAWAWHCHRLASKPYKEYCYSTYGRTIEAFPPFSMVMDSGIVNNLIIKKANNHSIDTWMHRYPNEPFFLDVDTMKSSTVSFTNEEVMSLLRDFDLLASVQRQEAFLWQVSGPRYVEYDFLRDGVENYYKFLKLVPIGWEQHLILIPTYQIDLMWHTHILSSTDSYNQDCMNIMNKMIHHDDSYTDRTEGGILDVCYNATNNIWKEQYGTNLHVDGGMYRGEPPPVFYTTPDWSMFCKINDDGFYYAGDLICDCNDINEGTLIGKVGASSTGNFSDSTSQLYWIAHNGTTSDGKQAFIGRSSGSLLRLPYVRNYVLGEMQSKIGYFHIETLEANMILYLRVKHRIKNAEAAMLCTCCWKIEYKQQQEHDLLEMDICRNLLLERINATFRSSPTKTKSIGSQAVYGADGSWLYPNVLYNCAGGACGGAVYRKAQQLSASANGGGGGGGSSGCGGCCGGCGG